MTKRYRNPQGPYNVETMSALVSRHTGKIRVGYRMIGLIAQGETLDGYAPRFSAGMLNARSDVLTFSSSVDSYPSLTWLIIESLDFPAAR